MKKLLLASVAVSGLVFAAAPAHADVDLSLGGYFKGYGAFINQDETAGTNVQSFDIIRDTEIHIGGETTLDNGLTVGAHFELMADGGDNMGTDESYAYFSGDWGRVNFGAEDGAGYLLQVAAPSADSNYDGIRQYVSPFVATGGFTAAAAGTRLDYSMDPTLKADKFTYLSPIFSGFQVGLSYTPDSSGAASSFSVDTDTNTAGTIQQTYEVAARYEGTFQNVGVIAGAGYSYGQEEGSSATTDDRQAWNLGLDLDIGPFGVGGAFVRDNNATRNDTDTWVLGADYTTGPFKLGASYLKKDIDNGSKVDRYTGGVTYEYGQGMSFRGTITHVAEDTTGATDPNGTAVLLGTQVNF